MKKALSRNFAEISSSLASKSMLTAEDCNTVNLTAKTVVHDILLAARLFWGALRRVVNNYYKLWIKKSSLLSFPGNHADKLKNDFQSGKDSGFGGIKWRGNFYNIQADQGQGLQGFDERDQFTGS
jgi:hypothetical protein